MRPSVTIVQWNPGAGQCQAALADTRSLRSSVINLSDPRAWDADAVCEQLQGWETEAVIIIGPRNAALDLYGNRGLRVITVIDRTVPFCSGEASR